MESTTTQEAVMTSTTTHPLPAIRSFMERFVIFSEEAHAEILALWVLHTWTFDAAYSTPYLYVNSAEKQSGKTRVLEVAQLLARNPISTANISTAGLFRMMGDVRPTVFLDEVDTVFSGAANEELRGVLNSGYKQGGSVMRFNGVDVDSFPTFCPKMLVGIDNGQMPDTLRDRCIPLNLKRKKSTQEVERFVPRKIEAEADELRAQIETWAMQNMDKVMAAPDPKVIEGISDRAFEIAEPLLVLARVCGAVHEKSARKALLALLGDQDEVQSAGVRLLQQVKDLMEEGHMDKVQSATIAAHVGVNPKMLGNMLKRYGITPETLRFGGGVKAKGYRLSSFQDAWERYL